MPSRRLQNNYYNHIDEFDTGRLRTASKREDRYLSIAAVQDRVSTTRSIGSDKLAVLQQKVSMTLV